MKGRRNCDVNASWNQCNATNSSSTCSKDRFCPKVVEESSNHTTMDKFHVDLLVQVEGPDAFEDGSVKKLRPDGSSLLGITGRSPLLSQDDAFSVCVNSVYYIRQTLMNILNDYACKDPEVLFGIYSPLSTAKNKWPTEFATWMRMSNDVGRLAQFVFTFAHRTHADQNFFVWNKRLDSLAQLIIGECCDGSIANHNLDVPY